MQSRSEPTRDPAILDAMVAAIPDLMFRQDREGRYLDVHEGTPLVVELSASEIIGKTVHEVLPGAAADVRVVAIARALATGTVQTHEFDVATPAGLRHYEARVAPITGIEEVIVVVRDITERVERQRELETLLDAKTDLLASVAHELRNPVASVLGFAEMVENRRLDDGTRQEAMGHIVTQAAELSWLIEDLLTSARRELGRLSVRPEIVDLAVEAEAVVRVLAPTAVAGILSVFEPAATVADPSRVRQVCRNLLTNALKYGGANVEVVTGTADGRGFLAVRDDGAGVPEPMLHELFERHRPDPNAVDSNGIGLALSRDIARMMGGDVVYRRDGDITEFRLTLPAASVGD